MISDEAFLRSQLAAVESLLADLPHDEQFERIGLESRRSELQADLAAAVAASGPIPASVELTFRGPPVVGSQGIEAGFAAKALGSFKQAIAIVAADIRGLSLADTGRLPGSERLFITGTAVGSFGFTLAEVAQPLSNGEPSVIAESINQTKALIESCAQGDESLADALGQANPRVLNPIREFLSHLKTAEAMCTVATPNGRFRFESTEEVERALERATLGVNEDRVTFTGVLRGVLPDTRKFEFKKADGVVISGKIDRELDNPEALLGLQGRTCNARVLVREVGRARIVQRFTLLSLDVISPT